MANGGRVTIPILAERIDRLDARVANMEGKLTWISRMVAGTLFSAVVAIFVGVISKI